MATMEAVARRRATRRLRSSFDEERRRERERRNEKWALRMIRRCWIPPGETTLMHLDYRYWLARRCGWDALKAKFSRDLGGKRCHPSDSAMWKWWCELHGGSRVALARACSEKLHHPRHFH